MRYQSAYYAHAAGEARVFLTLQQLRGRGRRAPVLFGCVCRPVQQEGNDAAEYCMTKLLDWFRHSALALCRSGGGREICALREGLEERLADILTELSRPGQSRVPEITGLLCVGEGVVFFRRGSGRVLLLQQSFDRDILRELAEGEDNLVVGQGAIRGEVGILLAAGSFCARLEREEMEGCLRMREMTDEDRLRRRLRELGEMAVQRGAQGTGAVLVRCIGA